MMMIMETANLEENQNQMMIIKGKRTKRPRLSSPMVLTTTASSSSSPGDVEDHHHHHNQLISTTPVRVSDQDDDDDDTTVSPATSSADEFTEMSTTEEEEDMANCLILLAQSGQTQIRKAQEQEQEQEQLVLLQQQAPIKAVAAADTAPGLYVYECKTCNRCFSSFQALGGHRASHKKPKLQAASNVINTTQAQPKKALSFMEDQDEYDRRFNYNATSTTLSLQISNRGFGHSRGTNKVHECSVCGAEFASGQALGGHMRRHRTFITPTATAPTMSSTPQSQATNKRPRSVLELDLNLPAPEEERLEMTKLPFSSSKKEQVIVFSSSALVGCHY